MQVKVFEAADMASGLRKVRRELGPDALILSTRTVKNGKLGLLGKNTLEITAAIDKQWPEAPPVSGNSASLSRADKAYRQNTSQNNSQNSSKNKKNTVENDAGLPPPPAVPASGPGGGFDNPTVDSPALLREFDELRNMVKGLAGEISRISSSVPLAETPAGRMPTRTPIHNLEHKLRSSSSGNIVEEILLNRGITNEAARIISTFAAERLNEADLADADKVYGFLHTTLADILTVNTPDFSDNSTQKRMAFVGPTGVGKTTTLAKIAAKYLSSQSNSIALITIDTYRIAAVEQLKVYGEIMHLPVEVVITPQQLKDALDKHRGKELILIDTAGRSPHDALSIIDLQSFLPPELEIDNYLVLSATTRDNELLEAYAQFSQIPLHSTIFTKIDECSRLGVLLNIQVQNGNPISYVTNGQRVPEDILEADKNQLAQLIIPSPNGIVHD